MVRLSGVLLLALISVGAASNGRFLKGDDGDDKPKPGPHGPPGPHGHHHHGPFEPRFEIISKNRTRGLDYELRQYNSSSWAATNVSAWQWEFALPKAVKRLAAYARGENDKGKHFPPSVPILSRYVPRGNYSNCDKKFTVYSYLPQKRCNSTNTTLPEPLNKAVKVYRFPPAKVYARTFPGLSFHWNFLHEAFSFASALRHDNITIRGGFFFAAVYDPPFQLFHRRNEVWFVPPRNSSDAGEVDFLWGGEGLEEESSVAGTLVDEVLAGPTATA